jgi:hypothetical protein
MPRRRLGIFCTQNKRRTCCQANRMRTDAIGRCLLNSYFLGAMLRPNQIAALAMSSWPYFPDMLALAQASPSSSRARGQSGQQLGRVGAAGAGGAGAQAPKGNLTKRWMCTQAQRSLPASACCVLQIIAFKQEPQLQLGL